MKTRPDHPSPIWHPLTQHAQGAPEIHVNRAEGAYLYAADEDGRERRIIDAISSWWVVTHGHCHPRIVKAVQAQAETLDQVIFAGLTHAPAERLAEKLLQVSSAAFDGASGAPHEYLFFSDSGSTAVEVALKMAIGFWQNIDQPRRRIIALEGGYHGDTFGAMAAGARGLFTKPYEPYLFDVQHIPVPLPGHEEAALSHLEDLLKREGAEIAAFIFEPLVQGAGGFQMYKPDALKAMYDLCKAYDILLIADEVMTGFGRTGTMFACAQAGIIPDIMCLSKGLTGGFLPMGATLCTAEIYRAFYHKDRSKMFMHSTSFTGNPLSCAAALASLEIWETEPVMAQIQAVAKSHERVAAQFLKRGDVNAVRSIGAILALDIDDGGQRDYLSAIGPTLYRLFLSRNVLLRPLGQTVYILPPYCVTQTDLDEIYDCITFALDHLGDERKQQAA
jgi:adenosylmethionine-8-amino-7-oxononanoate aminotransferase